MLKKIKEIIRRKIYKRYNISFSQGGGDDIQLYKLLKATNPGVYVDIGCWHPVKASNTYFFNLRGWKGICIDPNPELKKMFDFFRPQDNFVNCAVGLSEGKLAYYQMDANYSAMNTLNHSFIEKHNLQSQVKKVTDIPIYNLKTILDDNIKNGDRLDFFDIDVEGLDLEVLKSNDWIKYRPKVILVESSVSLQQDINSEIVNYLQSEDYRLVAKSVIYGDLGNLFLMDNKQ